MIIPCILFMVSQINAQSTVTDVQGNSYNIIKIGKQYWLKENLKTTKLNDGTDIANVTDNTAWAALTTPGYCWYDNDVANTDVYGALYNYYTVNTGLLCPTGWHVPTAAEWDTLSNLLGGAATAGIQLKEAGSAHWQNNDASTNESSFTALPGGGRISSSGTFNYPKEQYGYFWTSTPISSSTAYGKYMNYYGGAVQIAMSYKRAGMSVRCICDTLSTTSTIPSGPEDPVDPEDTITTGTKSPDAIEEVGYEDYDIAVNSSNIPYIAYIDPTPKTLKMAKWDGTDFDIETVDNTVKVRENVAIAIDQNNNPGIAYNSGEYSSDNVMYTYWNGSSWQSQTVASGNVPNVNDLVYDNSNNPIVLYTVWGSTTKGLYLSWHNGSSWVHDTLETEGVLGGGTIKVTANNVLHISYGNTNHELIYAKIDGTTKTKTVLSNNFTHQQKPQIDINSSNLPEIGCVLGSDSIKIYEHNGTSWTNNFVTKTYFQTGCAMELSSNDNAQFTQYTSYTVKHVLWNGSSATTTDIKVFVEATKNKAPIAVDANNNYHIVYYFQDTLRYATSSAGGGTSGTLSVLPKTIKVDSKSDSATFVVTADVNWTTTNTATWITITPTSGIKDDTVKVSCSENTTSSDRTAQIIVSGSGLSDTITVTQSGTSTSISSIGFNSVEIFPNPAFNNITFSFIDNSNYNVAIFNISGKAMLNTTINSKNNIIEISTLPKGVYVLKISNNLGTIEKKLIKK